MNRPASPTNLLAGLSITSDDNDDYEVIEIANNSKVLESICETKSLDANNNDDDDDDDTAETIIDSPQVNSSRIRQNSIPTSFNHLKQTIRNGTLSVAMGYRKRKTNHLNAYLTYLLFSVFFLLFSLLFGFVFTKHSTRFAACLFSRI